MRWLPGADDTLSWRLWRVTSRCWGTRILTAETIRRFVGETAQGYLAGKLKPTGQGGGNGGLYGLIPVSPALRLDGRLDRADILNRRDAERAEGDPH